MNGKEMMPGPSLGKVIGQSQPYRGPRFPERPRVAACNKKFRRTVLLRMEKRDRMRFDYEARVTVADRFLSRRGQRYFRMVNGQIIRPTGKAPHA